MPATRDYVETTNYSINRKEYKILTKEDLKPTSWIRESICYCIGNTLGGDYNTINRDGVANLFSQMYSTPFFPSCKNDIYDSFDLTKNAVSIQKYNV